MYQHYFNDASRPASKANPQSISVTHTGEVLLAKKVTNLISNNTNSNNNTLAKATAGLMRYKQFKVLIFFN